VSLHHTGEEFIFLSRDDIKMADPGLYSAQVHGYGAENTYRLTIEKSYEGRKVSEEEQAVLDDIYKTCCFGSSCPELRPLVRRQDQAPQKNFCHEPDQACNQDGHITALRLPNNHMDCELPDSIANLPFLKRLDLEDNYLFGEVSKLLTLLQGTPLLSIHLQKNDFTGPLACFPTVGNITELQYLDASYNRINGTIPACFFSPNLMILTLEGNYLQGQFPQALPASSTMKHVDLSWQEEEKDKRFTGNLPDFSVWCNLTYLNVARNDFTGGFPLLPPRMEDIHVEYNRLGGALPANLAKLPLKVLHIQDNDFTGALPTDLPETMESLLMGDNSFIGSIPAYQWLAAGLESLQEVRLEGNSLTGGIPSVFGAMTNLRALNLTSNKLSGSLDNFADGISTLNKISQFEVADNSLTGTIPPSLSELYMLQGDYDAPPQRDSFQRSSFDVSNNQLTGTIPLVLLEDAADQQSLLRFDLGGNQLSCPGSWLDLPLRSLPWSPKPLGDMTCIDEEGEETTLRESQDVLRSTSTPEPSATFNPTDDPTVDPTAAPAPFPGKDDLDPKDDKVSLLPTDPSVNEPVKRGDVAGEEQPPAEGPAEPQDGSPPTNTILISVGVAVGALLVTVLTMFVGVRIYRTRRGKAYSAYDDGNNSPAKGTTTMDQATVDVEQQGAAEVAMAEMQTYTDPHS